MANATVLSGMRVAVSRRPFPDMKREQVVQMLRDFGAQVVNEVTNQTDFVLCDEKSLDQASTPKIRMAVAKGVPVLLPSDFEKLKSGTPLSKLGFRGDANPSPRPAAPAASPQATKLDDRLLDLAPVPGGDDYHAQF